MIKQVVEKRNAACKEVSPKPFYSLIVDTTPTDNATSSNSPQWMTKHEVTNFIVFPTSITSNPDGNPKESTAWINSDNTVSALLLFEQ